MTGLLRRVAREDAGVTLPELLVGTFIGAMIMTSVASTIFTTNDLRVRADDRTQVASDLAVVAMRFDMDATMASPTAPARSQTGSASCDTAIDLGLDEGGAPVRYRTVSGSPAGPQWLERVSGSGTLVVARNVSDCTWRVTQDGSGHQTIQVTLSLTGATGESVSQKLRAAPRLW
jgi:hypothetical protein